jgi:hypothetical protein
MTQNRLVGRSFNMLSGELELDVRLPFYAQVLGSIDSIFPLSKGFFIVDCFQYHARSRSSWCFRGRRYVSSDS